MTVLWISLGALAAIALGWCILRRHRLQQRSWDWQPPTETQEVPGDKWVQDYIHRLGRDVEERSPRFKNWRPS